MRDWVISKRQLGLSMIVAGVLGGMGVLLLDVIRGAADFGPTQALALAGSVGVVVVGLTLLPLGDRPA